jgi:hypothetical protein
MTGCIQTATIRALRRPSFLPQAAQKPFYSPLQMVVAPAGFDLNISRVCTLSKFTCPHRQADDGNSSFIKTHGNVFA